MNIDLLTSVFICPQQNELSVIKNLLEKLVDKATDQARQRLPIHDAQEILKTWNLPVMEKEQVS